jgi:putative ABC transport system ATP-binding protein
MVEDVVRITDITKIYPLVSGDVTALNNLSLTIIKGEFVAIIGPYGSGKSTLLNQIGCLDVPTSGDLQIGGKSINRMSDYELTDLRLVSIGFIFQKFNLLPLLSAYEDVEYPYILKYRKRDTSDESQNSSPWSGSIQIWQNTNPANYLEASNNGSRLQGPW